MSWIIEKSDGNIYKIQFKIWHDIKILLSENSQEKKVFCVTGKIVDYFDVARALTRKS